MANNEKRGLGRGLSALMSDIGSVNPEPAATPRGLQTVPVDQIAPNPDQPRRRFADEALADLAASIAEKGVLQPLIVRAVPGAVPYQIVAGERRWRAAQRAQVHDVPVVIRELSDLDVLQVAIIENVQRADLNPIEEAAGYRALIDRFGHTQDQVSAALGKSRSHIANLLRLLQLPHTVQDMVTDGRLSAGHARALITSDSAEDLALQVIAKGLSVRDTEKLAKSAASGGSSKGGNGRSNGAAKDADTKALEQDLSAALGMSVSVDPTRDPQKGKVTISYGSLDELDELCRVLSLSRPAG